MDLIKIKKIFYKNSHNIKIKLINIIKFCTQKEFLDLINNNIKYLTKEDYNDLTFFLFNYNFIDKRNSLEDSLHEKFIDILTSLENSLR